MTPQKGTPPTGPVCFVPQIWGANWCTKEPIQLMLVLQKKQTEKNNYFCTIFGWSNRIQKILNTGNLFLHIQSYSVRSLKRAPPKKVYLFFSSIFQRDELFWFNYKSNLPLNKEDFSLTFFQFLLDHEWSDDDHYFRNPKMFI